MRHASRLVTPAALAAALLAGCGRTPKVDNPVLGPPPPRISMDDRQSFGDERFVDDPLTPEVEGDAGGELRTVALVAEDTLAVGPHADTTARSRVVARVNGEPILEGDVLDPYLVNLEKTRPQMTDRQYEDLKAQLVARDLEGHIERKLLIQALKTSLKAEQFSSIEKRIEDLFEAEVAPDMREKVGVTTNYELARHVEDEGQSLEAVRRSFVNQQLAMVYRSQNTKKEFEIGHVDLLDYYARNRETYEIKPRARWQRLQIEYGRHGGKEGALDVLEKAVAELRGGASFEDVIRKFSDGPRAGKGGAWDWTGRGELKDERIEKALFALPIGALSQVYADDASYQIVRVVERREPGVVPFEEVQEEIRFAVEKELKERESERVIAELRSRAEITSVLDGKTSDVQVPIR